jgi:peptide/nickel transport system permease protein
VATRPETDFSFDTAGAVLEEEPERRRIEGLGPWQLALRRLRRNRVALAFGVLFLLMVALSLAAPLYSKHVADISPQKNNVTGKVERGGKQVDVVSPEGKPIGPGWGKRYLLGADANGRDVMVRLLYGGRNSLFVGFMAAVITTLLAVTLGVAAGFFRGFVDRTINTFFDIVWSFPALLFGIALGTALALQGLKLGPISIEGGSIWIPTLIIGVVYIPYLGRPIRGQVLSLREKEFVEAAVAQGMSPTRIMFAEILPNVSSTILVFSTLIVAQNIITEAGLSFLGAGIQSPEPSWGNLIADGVDRLVTAPHLAIAPGIALALTVLSLNVFGDGVRDALDPRAKVKLL